VLIWWRSVVAMLLTGKRSKLSLVKILHLKNKEAESVQEKYMKGKSLEFS
jgi:hypothetical protein